MYENKISRRVAFHETDMAGIVHFSNYFKYVEEAEAGLFRALDLGSLGRVWGAVPGGCGFARLRAELDFLSPARLDELLTVHVWVVEKASRTLVLGCRISIEQRLVARGWLKTICITTDRTGGHAACHIPAEIDAALETAPWGSGWPPL